MASEADKYKIKFDQLKPLFGTYHAQVAKNRRYYNLEFSQDVVPEAAQNRGFVAVIPPTARQAVDEAADHILYLPKVRIPTRPTESKQVTEQEIAEKKRKFMTAWWRQITQRNNPLGDGRKTLLNEGKIVIKKTIKWDMIPDKSSKNYKKALSNLGKYDFLWDVELLDNVTVYEDPSDHRNPQYVYLQYKVYVEEAKRQFPEATGEWTKHNDYHEIEYTECWTAPVFDAEGGFEEGKFIQWMEQEVVHVGDNPYPYIPIAIEDSGYGTNRRLAKIEDKFRGLTEFTHDVFVAQARQWSAMEAVAEQTAFAPIKARNIDESKLATMETGPGAVWPLEGEKDNPNSEDMEIVQFPTIPQTVLSMIALTDRAANSTLKLDVLGGIPQTGVDTATEADQNVRNASAKLSSPVAALERLAAKVSRWVFMDIELLEAPVSVYGVTSSDPGLITLGPKEIAGYYDCYVELMTTDEDAIAQNKARFWLEMPARSPALSYLTALERGGIVDDPLNEFLRRRGEEVFISQPLELSRILAAAKALGDVEAENAARSMGTEGEAAGGINQGNTFNEEGGTTTPVPPGQESLFQESIINRNVQQGAAQLSA